MAICLYLIIFASEVSLMRQATISYKIKKMLSVIPEGEIFNHGRFASQNDNQQSIVKALSRLTEKGALIRFGKGKYYKPRQTKFGILRPSESEMIKAFTRKGNKQVGYLTGLSVYNKLGLTTQVSNVLVIARTSRLPEKELNGYTIKFILRSLKFTEQDIFLLQLLDALRDIREIPDTSVDKSIIILVSHLGTLSDEKLNSFAKLALEYNPATRALAGAILEHYFGSVNTANLFRSLNTLTKYNLSVSGTVLPNSSKWNIK